MNTFGSKLLSLWLLSSMLFWRMTSSVQRCLPLHSCMLSVEPSMIRKTDKSSVTFVFHLPTWNLFQAKARIFMTTRWKRASLFLKKISTNASALSENVREWSLAECQLKSWLISLSSITARKSEQNSNLSRLMTLLDLKIYATTKYLAKFRAIKFTTSDSSTGLLLTS